MLNSIITTKRSVIMKNTASISKLSRVIRLTVLVALALSASAVMSKEERHIVRAKSDADFAALKEDAVRHGGKIVREIPEIGLLVVSALPAAVEKIAVSPRTAGIAKDRIRSIVPPGMKSEFFGTPQSGRATTVNILPSLATIAFTPDPANLIDGLLWNLPRIGAPQAWKATLGDPIVKVAVADTGLDYTHAELAGQVESVVDLKDTFCKDSEGISDADLAVANPGGSANGDWHGHGTWIGGNIAASLDGLGINGIAPKVKLVSLKISEWCGSDYDSTIIAAFIKAADLGIDIVSISFGGYDDRNDPDQNQSYLDYANAVAYARSKGTVIVAAGGNEHVRIGAGGQVLSHSNPGNSPVGADLYGFWVVPAGLPGVVDVAATGNVVNPASTTCPPNSTVGATATCKPVTDAHQPFGVGRKNQLAYYSNYGPRIDIAAPGGARKFNLPTYDRGGTPGWPWTEADGFNAWQEFSITSNWATGIRCFNIIGNGFLPDQCYSTIQGTSMATPHVSAALALIASKEPGLRHNPRALVAKLKEGAQHISGNKTPPYSSTDTSPGDRVQSTCVSPYNYCHLGGAPISDREAYGAGLVNAKGSL
jgi:lantibiotic leader peptide-processing serine protease